MAPNPSDFLDHLESEGYNPRSNKHSNALAEAVVADLVRACESIRDKAATGRLVYDLNRTLYTGTSEWNVDLVLGEPPMEEPPSADRGSQGIERTPPSTIQMAIEIKSVMTEHKKAIKNRKRDFEAHHDHVHRYNPRAVAGGLLVVNAATTFQSPLRKSPTTHRDPNALVEHCVRELRAVAVRSKPGGTGLDAKGVLVVDYDNQSSPPSYVLGRAAPQVGDPLHYDAFIQALCGHYRENFG